LIDAKAAVKHRSGFFQVTRVKRDYGLAVLMAASVIEALAAEACNESESTAGSDLAGA
jgi:hypothetical protein